MHPVFTFSVDARVPSRIVRANEFGETLRRHMGEEWTQEKFGDAVARAEGRPQPYSQQNVWRWLDGRSVPDHRQVVAMEKVLRLRPGTLTRLLGSLPLESRSITTVEDAISADTDLSPVAKEHLLAQYRWWKQRELRATRQRKRQ